MASTFLQDTDEKNLSLQDDLKLTRKASSVHAEVELLQKLRAEQEEKQKRRKSVSILGQVGQIASRPIWYRK